MSSDKTSSFSKLSKDVQETLSRNIRSFDVDNDGIINVEEFKAVLNEMGIKTYDDKEVEEIMNEFDVNKDGSLTVEEVMEMSAEALLNEEEPEIEK
ncbi:hypothetical protein AKO1_013548 [Acrasis kona]|uniref:EF-hand domain-containing protein n=1 Tax=Acrasis kona TaxID=1008807 RepID=A0AAW2ZHQ1_9EUKA